MTALSTASRRAYAIMYSVCLEHLHNIVILHMELIVLDVYQNEICT